RDALLERRQHALDVARHLEALRAGIGVGREDRFGERLDGPALARREEAAARRGPALGDARPWRRGDDRRGGERLEEPAPAQQDGARLRGCRRRALVTWRERRQVGQSKPAHMPALTRTDRDRSRKDAAAGDLRAAREGRRRGETTQEVRSG